MGVVFVALYIPLVTTARIIASIVVGLSAYCCAPADNLLLLVPITGILNEATHFVIKLRGNTSPGGSAC